MKEPGEFQINVRMTPEQGVEFLKRLAEDDEFRDRFQSDTLALLSEWGIDVSEDVLPERVQAPTKGLVIETLELLEEGEAMMPQPFRPPFAFWLVFLALSRASRE